MSGAVIGGLGGPMGFGETAVPYVELPACPDTGLFLNLLEAIGEAANAAGLLSLILAGFPPPVDASVAWATLSGLAIVRR